MLRRLTLAAVVLTTAAVIPAAPSEAATFKVLVFSKTAGFRHDSIPAGIQAIRDLGAAGDLDSFTVTR
ncbi:hypothetical protein ACQP2K_20165 [Microbispora siamensis]